MAKVINYKHGDVDAKARQIEAWRRTLQHNRPQAMKAIQRAMGALRSRKVFHYTELNQYYAWMINGVAHPGEFGVNNETGCAKRA